MILIEYIYCDKSVNLCEYLKQCYNNITLCLFIEELPASWRELSLALIKTLKAIEDKKTVARKVELEFYIRFFAERQIHYIFNKYLPTTKFSSKLKMLITRYSDKDTRRIEECLKNISDIGCKLIEKPHNDNILSLYSAILKYHGFDVDFDNIDKKQKIILGIIGCGDILIKK